MSGGATAHIDLNALQHNLQYVKRRVGQSAVLAMIKSNGYGHGLIRVAKALSQAQALGVALLDEALILRRAGITQPIVVMSGFHNSEQLQAFVAHDLSAVVHDERQLLMLERQSLVRPLKVWLKLDTGMHRLGFNVDTLPDIQQRLQAAVTVHPKMVIMTHLADADNVDKTFTRQQLASFSQAAAAIDVPKSIANSAAIFQYPESLVDWVRPGLMLFGVSPLSGITGIEADLKPVMTLTSRLIAVKSLVAGDRVGYGCHGVCPRAMRLGIVQIGYGDGYPWHAQPGTPTLVDGKVCPLVGQVSMDMIAIDLQEQSNAQVGDEVILWGKDLPVETIAQHAVTIPYDLLCSVTQRVQFKDVE